MHLSTNNNNRYFYIYSLIYYILQRNDLIRLIHYSKALLVAVWNTYAYLVTVPSHRGYNLIKLSQL